MILLVVIDADGDIRYEETLRSRVQPYVYTRYESACRDWSDYEVYLYDFDSGHIVASRPMLFQIN